MGTACIPSYANIFMARFEEKHIYPFIKDKVELHEIYLRYIYNMFFIWKGSLKALKISSMKINKK